MPKHSYSHPTARPARARLTGRPTPAVTPASSGRRRRPTRAALTAVLAPVLGVAAMVAGPTSAGAAVASHQAVASNSAAASSVQAAGRAAGTAQSGPAAQRFGDATHMAGEALSGPVVGLARTAGGGGYWVVDATGRVIPRGHARPLGSVGGHLHSPVVGMAATPDGGGYWLVTRAGEVFRFGDAGRFGSLRGRVVRSPIVGIAASVRGYDLAAADGRVYAFGTPAVGTATGSRVTVAKPIVGIAATADRRGYWLVGANGGVVAYGDATLHGSLRRSDGVVTDSVVAIAPVPSGRGYWLATASGSVYAFGAAARHGSTAPDPAGRRTVGLLSDASGHGYWELSTVVTRPAPPAPPAPAAPAPGKMLGTFSVTCYTGGGTTASGAPTGLNDVAVDPSVIPLGTRIMISGVGVRTALDTGGAIIGARLDIWEPTLQQCIDWGRQNEQVWLVP